MARPKTFFSPADVDNLRRGFYTQAATMSAVVLESVLTGDTIDQDDIDTAADVTLDLIEALVERIQGVTE